MPRSSILALLVLAACATHTPRPTETPRTASAVGHFTSIPWGFETRSHWIEGPEGVIVIDTQFLPSEAERLLVEIARQTDKPVVLALVLHANPDKFNGADVFRAHGIPVTTSAQVLAAIPEVAEKRRRAFLARYAPDYPTTDPVLESFGDATRTLDVAGLHLTLHVLGRGCSEAHVAVQWNDHLFVGDLGISQTHAWLELGYVDAWIARLDELSALRPRHVHPGRGPSGGPELLATSRAYLEDVRARVDATPAEEPRHAALSRLRREVREAHPDFGYPVFLFGLGAVLDGTRP
ncbi:MAG: hydrolase [Sandaracinus sp.]|nr:hydrolase [Sandaracinus sp.]